MTLLRHMAMLLLVSFSLVPTEIIWRGRARIELMLQFIVCNHKSSSIWSPAGIRWGTLHQSVRRVPQQRFYLCCLLILSLLSAGVLPREQTEARCTCTKVLMKLFSCCSCHVLSCLGVEGWEGILLTCLLEVSQMTSSHGNVRYVVKNWFIWILCTVGNKHEKNHTEG